MSEKFVPQEKSYDVTNTKSKELDSFAIGDLLHNDRYEILSHLGSGVSSVVKLGQDNGANGREVAIKIVNLRDESIDHTKFLKESERLSNLSYKGLPTIIEQWQEQDNYFIVMTYAGITLASFCESLSTEHKADFKNTSLQNIYLQILDVMEYVHNHDLAHLDLKPDNILIDQDTQNIKVIDFGLARKMSDDTNINSYRYTMVANHDYASPESRKNSGISCLSDIYSLGGILFYLSHDFTHPPSIPTKDKFKHFKEITFKCMQEDPSDRFQNISELKEAFLNSGNGIFKLLIPITLIFVALGFGVNYKLSNQGDDKALITTLDDTTLYNLPVKYDLKPKSVTKPPIKFKASLPKLDLFKEVKSLMKQAELKLLDDKPRPAYNLYLQGSTILSELLNSHINSDDVQALIRGKKLLNGFSDQDFNDRLEALKNLSKKRKSFLETKGLISRSNYSANILNDKAYMSLRLKDYSKVLKYLDEIKFDYVLSDRAKALNNGSFVLKGMSYQEIQKAKLKQTSDLLSVKKQRALQVKIAKENQVVKGLRKLVLESLDNKDFTNALVLLDKIKLDYPLSDMGESLESNRFALRGMSYRDIKQAKIKKIALQKPKSYTDSLSGVEFVYVPSGSFMMGSPSSEKGRYDREGPVHKVKISKGFYLGKHEVTQAEWRKVMSDSPSKFKGDSLPVERVSFDNIREYLKKLNKSVGCNYSDTIKAIDEGHLSNLKSGCYRLPTEAEWEYSARGGTSTAFRAIASKFQQVSRW